jgi:hypothetical protein
LLRRPSHALTLDAEQTLARAVALVAADDEARAARWSALADARLGFTRALAQWPANPRAARGLDAALRAMIGHALDAEDAAGARALCSELATKDPALDAEVTALEARVAKDRDRAVRWASAEGELDASGSRRARTVALASIGALFVVITAAIAAIDPEGRAPPTLQQKLASEAVITVVTFAILYWQRARMLASRGSRRIAMSIAAVSVALCLSTVASMAVGASIHGATVLTFLLLAVMFATMAASAVRVWPAAVTAAVGATLIAAAPSRMSVIVSATAGASRCPCSRRRAGACTASARRAKLADRRSCCVCSVETSRRARLSRSRPSNECGRRESTRSPSRAVKSARLRAARPTSARARGPS